MVSPGRVTAQSLDYYEGKRARSAEDYYSGRGEAQGTWLGSESVRLGIDQEAVTSETFQRVMEGRDPGTGEALENLSPNRKVLAVDMTFSAPKSVSVLWALAPPAVKAEIEAAHEAAVEAGFAYLETNCAWGRQGKAGVRKVQGQGLSAAAYRHRTSREADPQLHTHVVVANLVRFPDGHFGSLDTARFWYQAPTLTNVYQHELRTRLTERLGLDWGEDHHGMRDIKDFPEELKDLFSKRHNEIEKAAGEFGRSNPWTRQVQTLLTRKNKTPKKAVVFDDWKAEAATAGFKEKDVTSLLNQRKLVRLTEPQLALAVARIGIEEKLTATRSHFSRRDVIALLAAELEQGLTTDEIECIADEVINQSLVQLTPNASALGHEQTKHQKAGELPLTTPEMYAIEQRTIRTVEAGLGRSQVELTAEEIQGGLARHAPETLGADQKAMIEYILSSGNNVDCVVGDAGTGKTFSFEIANKILSERGYSMSGVALAAIAARDLGNKADMEASTIASLLYRINHPTPKFLNSLPDVLVIDEAVMVGTKATATIIEFCEEHEIKLILVGDAKQIPAIEAGGMFTMIDRNIGSARLYENHRQKGGREQQELVDAWKFHDPRTALALAEQLGQFKVFNNESEMIEEMLSKWAHDPQREEALMIATRHVEVRALNKSAQAIRRDAGELGRSKLETPVYTYRVGDRVRCKVRDPFPSQVENGTSGIVKSIGRRRGALAIETDDGKLVVLESEYVSDPEKLQLGYAITAHSTQGGTGLRAYVELSTNMNAEVAYTANSRANFETFTFAVLPNFNEKHAGFEPDRDVDPLDDLIYALGRRGAQEAASEIGERDDYCNYETHEIQEAIDEHHDLMTKQVIAQYDEAMEASPVDSIAEDVFIDPRIVRQWATENPELARTYQNLRLELSMRVRHEAALASVDPPAWAIAELGPVPGSPISRTYWREGYKHIARHRVRYGLTKSELAYGDGPQSPFEKRSASIARGRANDAKCAIRDAGVAIRGAAL